MPEYVGFIEGDSITYTTDIYELDICLPFDTMDDFHHANELRDYLEDKGAKGTSSGSGFGGRDMQFEVPIDKLLDLTTLAVLWIRKRSLEFGANCYVVYYPLVTEIEETEVNQ